MDAALVLEATDISDLLYSSVDPDIAEDSHFIKDIARHDRLTSDLIPAKLDMN